MTFLNPVLKISKEQAADWKGEKYNKYGAILIPQPDANDIDFFIGIEERSNCDDTLRSDIRLELPNLEIIEHNPIKKDADGNRIN